MCHSFLEDIQKTARAFCAYLYRVRYAAIALGAYTLLLHFRLFSSVMPGIDTESILYDRNSVYSGWLGIGRQGLVLSKYLLGDYVHNPYFAGSIALLFLVAACIIAPFLGMVAAQNQDKIKGESWLVLIFGMTVVSHPILTEQLYFTLQCIAITFSFLLLELALLSAHYWCSRKNGLWLIPAILLQIIPFSSYQAMVPLFLAGAVAMTLVQSLNTDLPVKKQIGYVVRLAIAFLGGFAMNQLITGIFFSGPSSYLGNQLAWGRQGFLQGFQNIMWHIFSACAGKGTFYFLEFGISCVLLLFLMIRHCFRVHDLKLVLWQLFLLFAAFAAPFYLSILQGTAPVSRAQLVLPFTSGLVLLLCLVLFRRQQSERSRRLLTGCAAFLLTGLCIVTVYHEASVTSRLYYTDAIRAQGDMALVTSLRQDIAAITGEESYKGAVVFLGRKERATNPSCLSGEVMGASLFDWDTDVSPRYYFSSIRIVGLMNCLGSSYAVPTAAQVETATWLMDSMACYPAAGSIIQTDGIVIVRLSQE